ncbi:hypothetical protein niasHT_026230 [Heterodera trifolii]|uniref:Secreted protein n=1 Tax=Heterodera trifolii TaxID=157864 RepID=A0ABD2JBZ9_9BILA
MSSGFARRPIFSVLAFVVVLPHICGGDFFYSEWNCHIDEAIIRSTDCPKLIELRNQNEPVGYLGLTWDCVCHVGEENQDLPYVPPWLESTTPPPGCAGVAGDMDRNKPRVAQPNCQK